MWPAGLPVRVVSQMLFHAACAKPAHDGRGGFTIGAQNGARRTLVRIAKRFFHGFAAY
jgi:hypothetical protein